MIPFADLRIIFVSACFLLLNPVIVLSDLGYSGVQAICRITLKNGSSFEGVCPMANGGYQRYLETNIFLRVTQDDRGQTHQEPILLNLDFRELNLLNGQVTHSDGSKSSANLSGATTAADHGERTRRSVVLGSRG